MWTRRDSNTIRVDFVLIVALFGDSEMVGQLPRTSADEIGSGETGLTGHR